MKFLRLALLTAAAFPAAASAAAPGATSAPAGENSAVASEATPADQQGAALSRENQRLAAELARAEATAREAQGALARQSAEIAAIRAETAASRIQLAKVQGELAAARSSIAVERPAQPSVVTSSAALERERTAHIATKAILAQREAQVQDLIAGRTRIESENRVLKASTDLAKNNAGDETKTALAQSAELAVKAAVLSRDLAHARSEISSVRQELRNQTAKTATEADTHAREMAALQESLTAARTELGQAKASLDVTAQSTAASSAAKAQEQAEQAAMRDQIAGLDRELQAATATVRRLTKDQTKFEALQSEVARLQREAQSVTTTPEAETIRLREALAKAEAAPKMSAADLAAAQIQERQLAALEQDLSSTRSQLGQTKSALDAAAQSAAASLAARTEAETQLAQLRTEISSVQRDLAAATTTAQKQSAAYEAETARLHGILARSNLSPVVSPADLEAARRDAFQTQRRLAAASEELEALRAQVAAARELEKRVRQLEAEKVAADGNSRETIDKEEFARVVATRAAAEEKLGIALRAYSLLARERDDLRAQVNELSAAPSNKTDTVRVARSTSRPATPVTPAAYGSDSISVPARVATMEQPAESAPTVRTYPPQPANPPRPAAPITRPVVPPGQPAFSHRIAAGETLSSIARRYYGSATRWPEIVAANRDVLPDQSSFSAGKMLRIP